MFSCGQFSTGSVQVVMCWSKPITCHQAGQGAKTHRVVLSLDKGRLRGDPKCSLQLPDWKIQRRQSQISLEDAFYHVSEQIPENVILRVVQGLTRQDFEQPGLTRPALIRGLEEMHAGSPFQP